MDDRKQQILQMLAEGKINTEQAEKLIDALIPGAPGITETVVDSGNGKKPKYLRVKVETEPGSSSKHGNVNVKVPLLLLKAGMKLQSLVPEKSRNHVSAHLAEHGIDLDLKQLDAEKLDALVEALTENSIDIDTDKEKIRIFCE